MTFRVKVSFVLSLKRRGWSATELVRRRKGDKQKVKMALRLKRETTMTLQWIAERLGMGHASRVSQAVARMRHRPGRRLQKLQRRLQRVSVEPAKHANVY